VRWSSNVRLQAQTRDKKTDVLTLITADPNGMMTTMMQDLAFSIPGVDEAMSFAEIMK
jgi:ssRNA-specific RNase YbeY (16S rRNA maturation enzyme)